MNFFIKPKSNEYTIASYNLENLFDPYNDPNILDDDFTTQGRKKWTNKRYQYKLNQLARVIRKLGFSGLEQGPAIIGITEVENKKVLRDLLNTAALKDIPYNFVHYNSPDERGIDVALLYRTDIIQILSSQTIGLSLKQSDGTADYTRDILQVTLSLGKEKMSVFVNHWPSRRDKSAHNIEKRITAAKRCRQAIDQVLLEDPLAKIIVLGDFNDDPHNFSIQKHLQQSDLYNPTALLHTPFQGSLSYRGKWNLFDQIIISNNFLKYIPESLLYKRAGIFNPNWLQVQKGRYKGTPYRTYLGNRYQGGYSDHFPVYIILRMSS